MDGGRDDEGVREGELGIRRRGRRSERKEVRRWREEEEGKNDSPVSDCTLCHTHSRYSQTQVS